MIKRPRTAATLIVAILMALGVFRAQADDHFDPVVKKIEGWTVHVDPKLLEGEHAEEGGRALKMLDNHLERLGVLMPKERLKEMRKLEIWIEHDHAINTEPGPYHPGVGWLTERGYDPRLAKKVHVTRAASLLERHHMLKHPAVILHELAHALVSCVCELVVMSIS